MTATPRMATEHPNTPKIDAEQEPWPLNRQPLYGIVPPMITPLQAPNELDYEGLEHLIERILGGGVHGLFILGTTGEAPSLSHELRMELITRVCGQVANRVPVLVGITDTAFPEQLEIASHANDMGADAVVTAPPYYFATGQPELQEYIEHLAAELPLPLVLYNMPGLTKTSFTPDLLSSVIEMREIVGLKDSSGDMTYFHQVQQVFRDRPDLSLLMGPEELLGASLLMGGHGGVCGGANVCPSLYVQMYDAAAAGDVEAVRRQHEKIMQFRNRIYCVGRHPSSIIKGIKCALNLLGICDDFMAEPFHRFRQTERARVQEALSTLNPS